MKPRSNFRNYFHITWSFSAKGIHERVEKYQVALKNDKGLAEKWYDLSYQAQDWKKMDLPQEWSLTEFGESDGIVWFKKRD